MQTSRFALYVGVLVFCAGLARAQDRVDRVKGPPLSGGTVTAEDFRSLTYSKEGAAATKVPAAMVLDVVRGDAPQSYREGKAAFVAGDAKNAVSLLRLALSEKDAKPWVKEYANYWLGEALRLAGSAGEAVAAYDTVLQVRADGRLWPSARIGKALALAESGKTTEAVAELKAFANEVDGKGLSPTWKLAALAQVGRVLEAQKKYEEAVSEYDAALATGRTLVGKGATDDEKRDIEVAVHRAQRDKGRALLRAKRYDDAEREFKALEGIKGDAFAAGAALLGLAESKLAQGFPEAARIPAAEALVVHFGAADLQPDAVTLLGRVYVALGAKGLKNGVALGRGFLEEASVRYPASEAAKEARSLLQTLK